MPTLYTNAMDIVNQREQEEYDQVRRDLIFVVTMNAIFFAILIGLYFFNRSTGSVDQFFAQALKF
ncbi:MAG: hypothetical protein A3I07_04070 [Candidatus Doudnabacteria bacterium RIFCSPLOWO2_02_FULL_42_9]|nr:MAG: hypothetical protein A3I07_04070 [Candidatus Doudnabacteria bacterium RIFCSPLOWO2_02_FULL_42_9]